MKKLSVFAWLWITVLLGTGLLGGLVVSRVGWSIAMGLAIYAGDTEPVQPDLPYPWLVFCLAVVVSLGGLTWGLMRSRRPAGQPSSPLRSALPLALAYLGGLFAAVLPFLQLYRLWSQVG